MKDYFASVTPMGVTGVTAGDAAPNARKTAIDKGMPYVTPLHTSMGDKGDAIGLLSPLVTLSASARVTPEAREIAALPPSPSDTPDYEALHCCYQERAGIYQFDAGYPQAEAERLAYRDALVEFLSQYHPTILAQFSALISPLTIH